MKSHRALTESCLHQPHKMIKHTQNIRRQQPTNCLNVFDHFVELTFKGLSIFVKTTL